MGEERGDTELSRYDYELPHALIAQSPLTERTDARMMVVDRERGSVAHHYIRDFPRFLTPADTLVLNNTQVIPARLVGARTETGAKWEGLFLRFDDSGVWEILSKTRGTLQPGEKITLEDADGGRTQFLTVVARTADQTLIVRPEMDKSPMEFLQRVGWVPLPPYIRGGRMVSADRTAYQTVYASRPGAVAAPTAGLHFTKPLLAKIQASGTAICPVTLHVGAGTFKPITAERIAEHKMHAEFGSISAETVAMISARRASGGRTVAVGTTTVRTLESASNILPDGRIDSTGNNEQVLSPFVGKTDLFIRPPYRFKSVDAILTNFHLPKSTLLILVRCFGGDELIRHAYDEAIRKDYRFYSYGDAMLIL